MIDEKRLDHVAVQHVWDHGGKYEWCLGDFTEAEASEVVRLARLGLSVEERIKEGRMKDLTALKKLRDEKVMDWLQWADAFDSDKAQMTLTMISELKRDLETALERVTLFEDTLQAIESGAVYRDGKPGKTPKTRARAALAASRGMK